jgi:hypothetical protein
MLLDPIWQKTQTRVMQHIFGVDRVLHGKTAFASLAAPHYAKTLENLRPGA